MFVAYWNSNCTNLINISDFTPVPFMLVVKGTSWVWFCIYEVTIINFLFKKIIFIKKKKKIDLEKIAIFMGGRKSKRLHFLLFTFYFLASWNLRCPNSQRSKNDNFSVAFHESKRHQFLHFTFWPLGCPKGLRTELTRSYNCQ